MIWIVFGLVFLVCVVIVGAEIVNSREDNPWHNPKDD